MKFHNLFDAQNTTNIYEKENLKIIASAVYI